MGQDTDARLIYLGMACGLESKNVIKLLRKCAEHAPMTKTELCSQRLQQRTASPQSDLAADDVFGSRTVRAFSRKQTILGNIDHGYPRTEVSFGDNIASFAEL